MPPARLPRSAISSTSRPWDFAVKPCRASPPWRACRWYRAAPARSMPGWSNARDGELSAPAPASHGLGTSVEVRDLFFNVPARRKFLRTEAHRISAHRAHAGTAGAVALRRGVSRSLTTARLSGASRRRRAAPSAWIASRRSAARNFAAHVIELQHETESLRLSGWLALPTFSRSQADLQFTFLNGRFVRDKLLVGAARLAYRDVLFHGRFCAYVLYLELDPAQVDVNAHPQKLEVRFRDSRRVHDFVFRTLEKVLADTRPSAESRGSAPADWLTGDMAGFAAAGPSQARFSLPRRRSIAHRRTPIGPI